MAANSRARQPNKASLTMRNELERRGIDVIEMQLAVYRKAMAAYDERRGCSDGYEGDEDNPAQAPKDTGAAYLSVANQAVSTLARYSFPTMAAVQVQNMNSEVNEKVIDATEVRKTILGDPFAAQVAHKATTQTDTGLPILVGGKKEE